MVGKPNFPTQLSAMFKRSSSDAVTVCQYCQCTLGHISQQITYPATGMHIPWHILTHVYILVHIPTTCISRSDSELTDVTDTKSPIEDSDSG